jgi:hypothetical protein
LLVQAKHGIEENVFVLGIGPDGDAEQPLCSPFQSDAPGGKLREVVEGVPNGKWASSCLPDYCGVRGVHAGGMRSTVTQIERSRPGNLHNRPSNCTSVRSFVVLAPARGLSGAASDRGGRHDEAIVLRVERVARERGLCGDIR